MNKNTGTKLANLTAPRAILDFFTILETGKDSGWTSQEFLVLRKLASHLLAKSHEAINPISNTSYSAVLVYKKNNNYLLFSGANIDPDSKEDLKNPLKRNCAEKQAAITAQRIDGLDNSQLCFMFLYRKQKHNECVPACKLVPCRDCYEKYLVDLMKNNGRLVLIMDDNVDRAFLQKPEGAPVIEKVHSIDLGEGARVNYKIFSADAMKFLQIENSLGERVCKV